MKFSPVLSVAALGFLLVGAACKQNVADLPARNHSQDGVITPVSLTTPSTDAKDAKVDPRDLPVRKVAGKPMWAANKSHTAEENAQYQFEHHGSDFAAANVDAYVAKVHDFTAHPPAGTQQATRDNGDVLMFDGKSGVFAVVSKEGAPRTMFKPTDGASYWAKQKETLAQSENKSKAPRKTATKSAQTRSSQG